MADPNHCECRYKLYDCVNYVKGKGCRALSDSNFKAIYCPFYKTTEQYEAEEEEYRVKNSYVYKLLKERGL